MIFDTSQDTVEQHVPHRRIRCMIGIQLHEFDSSLAAHFGMGIWLGPEGELGECKIKLLEPV